MLLNRTGRIIITGAHKNSESTEYFRKIYPKVRNYRILSPEEQEYNRILALESNSSAAQHSQLYFLAPPLIDYSSTADSSGGGRMAAAAALTSTVSPQSLAPPPSMAVQPWDDQHHQPTKSGVILKQTSTGGDANGAAIYYNQFGEMVEPTGLTQSFCKNQFSQKIGGEADLTREMSTFIKLSQGFAYPEEMRIVMEKCQDDFDLRPLSRKVGEMLGSDPLDSNSQAVAILRDQYNAFSQPLANSGGCDSSAAAAASSADSDAKYVESKTSGLIYYKEMKREAGALKTAAIRERNKRARKA